MQASYAQSFRRVQELATLVQENRVFQKTSPEAYKNAAIVSETLAKEVALGRVKVPFNNPPFPNLQISQIGVIPKKHSDKFRLIFHLSYPKTGDSINSFISKEEYSLQYTKIDNAIAAHLDFGPGTFMAKTDIESAFRIFPIHRDDWEHVLGKSVFCRPIPTFWAKICSI